MGVYHQMGHDSWNLVEDRALPSFKGIILSPVNSTPDEVTAHLSRLDTRSTVDVILDPQLYEPRSSRGKLDHWKHFSPDQDTADLGSLAWWKKRNAALAAVGAEIGANWIASPAFVPKVFTDQYYELTLEIGEDFASKARAQGRAALLTAIVPMRDLATEASAMRLASIFSRSTLKRLYVIFHDELSPREQRADFQVLAGAVQFLRALREAGIDTVVAFAGIDLVVWKAGRATDVATGKYFNLRRFDPARWGDESKEGRVKQYWTDAGMLTWFREEDLRLLLSKGLIDRETAEANPFSKYILETIDAGKGKAWLAVSWRQYLSWFQATERALEANPADVRAMLLRADEQWGAVQRAGVFLIDRDNDGRWVRAWLNALQQSG